MVVDGHQCPVGLFICVGATRRAPALPGRSRDNRKQHELSMTISFSVPLSLTSQHEVFELLPHGGVGLVKELVLAAGGAPLHSLAVPCAVLTSGDIFLDRKYELTAGTEETELGFDKGACQRRRHTAMVLDERSRNQEEDEDHNDEFSGVTG